MYRTPLAPLKCIASSSPHCLRASERAVYTRIHRLVGKDQAATKTFCICQQPFLDPDLSSAPNDLQPCSPFPGPSLVKTQHRIITLDCASRMMSNGDFGNARNSCLVEDVPSPMDNYNCSWPIISGSEWARGSPFPKSSTGIIGQNCLV